MGNWWKPAIVSVITLILAVSFKNEFLYFLLGFELMLILALFLQVIYSARKLSLSVEIPNKRVVAGEKFSIRAKVCNKGVFPVPRAVVRLAVKAFPEKDEILLVGKTMINASEAGSICFSLDGDHYLGLEVRKDQLLITDLLGVFRKKVKLSIEEPEKVFILPDFNPDGQDFSDARADFESENGDNERLGSQTVDPSEIRSYRYGDQKKYIHWKLSARFDELMIKETVDNTEKLVWLNLNLAEPDSKNSIRLNPDKWDRFIEVVANSSAALLELKRRHRVVWIDAANMRLENIVVEDMQSLNEMLSNLLWTDTYTEGKYLELLGELTVDETKGTCIEIDLQGNLTRSERA